MLGSFCLFGGCIDNPFFLTIAMTDSYGDGWNGNVFGIKQNGTVVGTFGTGFNTGYNFPSANIAVQGNIEAQIFVSTLGSWTNEVGFIVKAPNDTVIYQRTSGYSFNSTTIFATFCPAGGCPSWGNLTLNISLTDSFGDGWNGNILAVKQNGIVMGTFGSGFTTGTSSGPVYITVVGNQEAQVVISTLGSWTNEVGFVIKAPNGTTILQRTSGSSFNSTIIFGTFCPIGGCPINPNVIYTLTTSDYYGDGWEGTTLAFKQNGVVVSTFTLAAGSSGGPTSFTFAKLQTVSITVYVLGNYTN